MPNGRNALGLFSRPAVTPGPGTPILGLAWRLPVSQFITPSGIGYLAIYCWGWLAVAVFLMENAAGDPGRRANGLIPASPSARTPSRSIRFLS